MHLTCTGSTDTLGRVGELLACGVIDVALKAHHAIRRIGTTGRLRLRIARDNRMARRFVCRGLLNDEGTQDTRALIGALAGTQAHALYPEALRKGLFRMQGSHDGRTGGRYKLTLHLADGKRQVVLGNNV